MDVRQATINPGITERQLMVINSHQVQDRCMQVVTPCAIFCRLPRQIVTASEICALANAGTRQPRDESATVVVSSE